jgi:hypothetical protein
MNEGINILIERMKTNPEDFAPPGFNPRDAYVMRSDSWRNLAEYAIGNDVFTAEEKAAVAAALREVTRLTFTAKVLEIMTAPVEHNFSLVGAGVTQNVISYGYQNQMNEAVAKTKAALGVTTLGDTK